MKKTIRSFFTAAISLATLLITGSAGAAVNYLWDGDFDPNNLTKTVNGVTYTLALNGHEIKTDEATGKTYIEIGEGENGIGATVTLGTAHGSGATIYLKYSNITNPGTTAVPCMIKCNRTGGYENIMGLTLDSSNYYEGRWADGITGAYANSSKYAIPVSGNDIYTMALTYGNASGGFAYLRDATGWHETYKNVNLKGQNTYGIDGFAVGGVYQTFSRTVLTPTAMSGMKIYAIAFGDAENTAEKISNFAWQGEPSVMWDRAFPEAGTDQYYTITYQDGVKRADDGSYIEIDAESASGLGAFFGKNGMGAITVAVQYSDYAQSGSQTLATFFAGGVNNRVGVHNTAASNGIKVSHSNGGTYSGAKSTFPQGTNLVFFRYSNGGVYCFNASGTSLGGESGYKWATDFSSNVNGFTLGGAKVDTLANMASAKGMKIRSVAVFNQELTTAQMAAFAFPAREWVGESGADWSNASNWKDGKLPLAGDIVKLGEDDVVNVDASADLTGVTVQGAGTIILNSTGSTVPTAPGGVNNASWTGVVWIKVTNGSGNTGWTLSNYGNANSVVRFSGVYGYLNHKNGSFAGTLDLVDGTDGFAWKMYSGFGGTYCNVKKLTGNGTIDKNQDNCYFYYNFEDCSGFTGSITTGGYNICLGYSGYTDGSSHHGIYVKEGATATISSGKTWTTASTGSIMINGTLCGSGTLASATTFGENSSVVASLDGVLTITGAITGTVKIDGSAIDEAETKPDYVKVLTATAQTKPTCELIGVEGYELFWKGDDLYAGDSAKRALYKQFSYAGAIYTWRGANEIANAASLYYVFDPDFGIDQGTVEGVDYFKGNGTKYTNVPGGKATEHNFWTTFAYSNSTGNNGEGYEAPGCVLRFVESSTYNKTIGGGFGPLSLGGLLVEKGATGYKFEHTSGGRSNLLGDPTGTAQTYWAIYENFAYNRNGAIYLSGALVFDVADGKVFDLNSGRDANSQSPILVQEIGIGSNGNFGQSVAGGTLIMKGGGKLKVAKLTALGSTLDYSNLELGRESAFIEGNLTVDKDTTFKFPAGFNPSGSETDASFKLCDGTLTGAVSGKRAVAFGDMVKLVDITFDANGTVTYVDVNEKSWTGAGADTNWSTSANWDPADKPTANADVKIAAENDDVAINLDEDTESLASLTFSGSHNVTFSGTGAITATAIDFAYLTGKIVVPATGLTLNGAASGVMIVDPSAVSAGTTFLKGTAIAAANVSFVNVPDGVAVVKTDAGYEMKSATEFLRYGYAFEDNVTKEEAASESIDITNVSTYEAGVRTKALAFRTSKNHGTGFGFGGGDFTIFAVIKAPTDANKCIFSLGGQKGTTGMIGLRTTGANSVAVFTKDGTDLITAAVEDSATMFHYYALKYDSVANTIALSVDGGAFSDPVAYTSGTGGQFQFGGIHGGEISGKAENANNGAIDEFQLYTKKLATEQIQTLGAAFEPNTWKGVNGGAWNVASNWSYDTVPAAGESVIIPTGDTAEAYKIVLATDAEISLGSVKITGAATSFEFENGEVTMDALKSSVDIQVGANDTLIFPNRNASITLASGKAIKGSGRVVMVGNGLANTLDLLSAQFTGVKDANNWTGTLEFRDWCGMSNANYAKYGNFYGNANSTICFNGFKGHVYATDFDPIKAYEIGEDGAEFTGQFSSGNIGFIGDLIGSGDLKLSLTGNTAKNGYLRFVGDSSAYTGSFSFAGDNAFPISLIPATDTTMPLAEFSQRMIILAVEAGAWTVNGDVEVIAGASFDTTKAPTINGKIKFDSNILVKTTEVPSEDGVLFINDTQLTPGTISALAITVKVGEDEYTGYHPVTTEEGVVAKIVDVTSWSGEVEITESQNLNAVLVTGNCTVKGIGADKKVTLGSIAIGDGMTLTLDNVTIEVNELNVLPQAVKLVNGAHLVVNDQMLIFALAANETLEMDAGAQYTFLTVPNFNTASTIKITNAASLQPGNYLLMDWSNWPNPDLMGYGMPQLNVEGYTGEEGSSIRLVPEAYKLWLQVRSAAEMARPALTIEPIGDSITEGLNNAVGSGKNYRIPLFNKLSLAGYNVKSVGYWNHSGAGNYSLDPSGANATTANPDWAYHSGRGSARAGAVSGGNARVRDAWANDIDVGGAPDIVLLHIGINDMLNNGNYNDGDGTKTYEYIKNIVTGILRDRPDVKLVMSSPMANAHGHSEQTATYEDEPGKRDTNHKFCEPLHAMCLEFYNAVKAGTLLSDIPGAADRLFFADQYLAVQPSWYDDSKLYLNDGSDHCHPNWLGHELMAETWLAQIKAAFPDPEDKAEKFHSRRTNKGTYQYGAENNVPEEYRKGFKKVRVFNTSLTGTEQLTPGTAVAYDTTDEKTPDSAAVAKVGYYVEYVRETSTTNIHRFVWVDMDAFGGKKVANIGIPTMGNFQEVVNKLHVYGNHPAVFNIPWNDDTVKGFVEFTPHTYDDNNIPTIAGAPAHFAPYDWHDHLSDTGAHGCMQVHRILDPADQLRPAQVVFAYNAFTANGGNDQNTVLGIGNFSQSFQSSSTDWTNLHQAETCNATVYSVRNIEIWVKAAASDDSGNSYDTIEDAIKGGTPDAQGVTQITINAGDEPMRIDLTKLDNDKAFKLNKETSEGTVTWNETDTGKYISYKDGVMTVKEGTFPNVSFVENGLQAAALGIDVSNANDKPYLKSVQDDSTTMVKFNFYHGTAVDGIINPTGIGGLPVKYAVEYADSSDFSTGTGATEPTTEPSVSVDLPTNGTKTRYYRPKFSFGN